MLNRRSLFKSDPIGAHGGAISIGNFDGVHRGHAALITRLRAMADSIGGPAVAVTFDPSPAAVLRSSNVPPQLTTIARRTELLRSCGADLVLACQTDADLLSQSAEDFFRRLVVDELRARGVVEGPNFFFGKDRRGNTEMLMQLCETHRIAIEIVDPRLEGDAWVSSTRIRDLIGSGDVMKANALLTSPYQIRGTIVSGAARGRQIGFPTANLESIGTLIPGAGVYACRAWLDDGKLHDAATHIGPNPTFGDKAVKVEVHLLDFSGDLYGDDLNVQFLSRIRGVERFASTEALTTQLRLDIDAIRDRLRRG